jgi:predicted YcjX-like family ATPase
MAIPSANHAVSEVQYEDNLSEVTEVKTVTLASANRRKALRMAKAFEKNIDKSRMTYTITATLYITHVVLDDRKPDEED